MEDLRSNVHGWKISPPVVGWGWLQKELNPQVHNIKKTVSIHWIMIKIIIIVIIIILMWFTFKCKGVAAFIDSFSQQLPERPHLSWSHLTWPLDCPHFSFGEWNCRSLYLSDMIWSLLVLQTNPTSKCNVQNLIGDATVATPIFF